MKNKILLRFYPPHTAVHILFEPCDAWIGAYFPGPYLEGAHKKFPVYICLVPFFPIKIVVHYKSVSGW